MQFRAEMPRIRRGLRQLSIGLLAATLLAGCAGTEEPARIDSDATAEVLYDRAYRRLLAGNYDGAMQLFRTLEARHPFSPEGQQAQLDQIYATYLSRDRQGTAEMANRYIRENPRSEHLDYAYYMQGMAWFDQDTSFSRRLANLDPARLGIQNAQRSFDAFRTLVQRFPDSNYADDARMRMIHLRNLIARHHWHVANYYLERGAFMAAAGRASKVIEEIQPTAVTPYVMDVLAAAYDGTGEPELAEDIRRRRDANFDEHQSGQRPPRP